MVGKNSVIETFIQILFRYSKKSQFILNNFDIFKSFNLFENFVLRSAIPKFQYRFYK